MGNYILPPNPTTKNLMQIHHTHILSAGLFQFFSFNKSSNERMHISVNKKGIKIVFVLNLDIHDIPLLILIFFYCTILLQEQPFNSLTGSTYKKVLFMKLVPFYE
jgi:hypothetical protein